jgi:hypothetical protein
MASVAAYLLGGSELSAVWAPNSVVEVLGAVPRGGVPDGVESGPHQPPDSVRVGRENYGEDLGHPERVQVAIWGASSCKWP